MKILTVIGARPQFIKAAAVSAAIAKHPGELEEVLVHTGQHFDHNMSRIFFDQMGIPEPSYNLDIHSLSHGAMTGMMMTRLEELMLQEQPDMVMVYGDTNSTLAGSLTARKLNISVAHVESGLRSFDMCMPEEVNRVLTDRISNILFCPTRQAIDNLAKEGFEHYGAQIVLTGDVMLDAALRFAPHAIKPEAELPEDFILVTIHRQSNTDQPENLKAIMTALHEISRTHHLVVPLHPRTRSVIKRLGFSWDSQRITVMDPVGYLEVLWLLQHTQLVITDSGGLQKEAYFMGKGCITLRDETEWTELVEVGANITAGVSTDRIVAAFQLLLNRAIEPDLNLYGGGHAAEEIVKVLMHQ